MGEHGEEFGGQVVLASPRFPARNLSQKSKVTVSGSQLVHLAIGKESSEKMGTQVGNGRVWDVTWPTIVGERCRAERRLQDAVRLGTQRGCRTKKL